MPTSPRAVRDLRVWQKSIELVEACYRVSAMLPREERFGLTSQIKRACTSVPANIAEGFGRWNARDFARFIAIASGSLRELETHLLVAGRLQYLWPDSISQVLERINTIAAMLYRMRQRVLQNVRRTERPCVHRSKPDAGS